MFNALWLAMLLVILLALSGDSGAFRRRAEAASLADSERKERVDAELAGLARLGRSAEIGPRADQEAVEGMDRENWFVAARYSYWACLSHYQHRQMARAMRSALRGLRAARRGGLWELAALNAFGLAQVYSFTDNLPLALETGAAMMDYAARAPKYPPELHLLMGNLYRRVGRNEESEAQYRRVLELADLTGNQALAAGAVFELGRAALKAGRIAQAEDLLVESFRLMRLHRKETLGWAYLALAELRIEQNRPREALALLERTLAQKTIPRADTIHFAKARAHLVLGERKQALRELRDATRWMGSTRAQTAPVDDIQIGVDVSFQQIYTLYARTAIEEYARTGEQAFLGEALNASLENRAASLRRRMAARDARSDRLPPRYYEVLARLRAAEVEVLRTEQEGPSAAVTRYQRELAEMESALGRGPHGFRGALQAANAAEHVAPGEIILVFQLDEPRSFLWLVDRQGLSLRVLPSGADLTARIRRFRRSVETDSETASSEGSELARILFPGVDQHTASTWTLLPDGEMFALPLGALILPDGRYLGTAKALRVLPYLGDQDPEERPSSQAMVAVGDPITNLADPRWEPDRNLLSRLWPRRPTNPIQLPRLAGSLEEVDRCMASWQSGATIGLLGRNASPARLKEALAGDPEVLHLATHIYQPIQPSSPVIALSLDQGGRNQVLTETEIETLTQAPRLVTLSGCGSGRGPLAPGAGLLGLTRAWLMAGSQAVVATHWPVLDSDGRFFAGFYFHYQQQHTAERTSMAAARSLQQSVRHLLESDSPPRLSQWAGYFVLGTH